MIGLVSLEDAREYQRSGVLPTMVGGSVADRVIGVRREFVRLGLYDKYKAENGDEPVSEIPTLHMEESIAAYRAEEARRLALQTPARPVVATVVEEEPGINVTVGGVPQDTTVVDASPLAVPTAIEVDAPPAPAPIPVLRVKPPPPPAPAIVVGCSHGSCRSRSMLETAWANPDEVRRAGTAAGAKLRCFTHRKPTDRRVDTIRVSAPPPVATRDRELGGRVGRIFREAEARGAFRPDAPKRTEQPVASAPRPATPPSVAQPKPARVNPAAALEAAFAKAREVTPAMVEKTGKGGPKSRNERKAQGKGRK